MLHKDTNLYTEMYISSLGKNKKIRVHLIVDLYFQLIYEV